MSSLFPCPEFLRDCDCSAYPVRNFSQEAADLPVFFGNYNQPPTDGSFFAPGCFGVCESVVSQEAADECAANQAVECSFDNTPGGGNPIPGGGPMRRYGNATQECTKECPDSVCEVTSVIGPGTVISAWQADANARAQALACKEAQRKVICFETGSPLTTVNADEFMSVAIVASGGTGSYVFTLDSGSLPAGLVLDAVGLISGTPTTGGTSVFDLRVTDSDGNACVKSFSLEVLSVCNTMTDWCGNPGTCRVRIQNFNPADWVAGPFPCDLSAIIGWNGTFSFIGPVVPPCTSYAAIDPTLLNPVFDIIYDPIEGWQMNFSTPGGTVFFANGPLGTSPLGTYIRDNGFSCTGPASLVIEPYSPP